MASRSKPRIDTLRVLVSAHRDLKNSARLTAITGEFSRILSVDRIGGHNGWLLTVLHTTRALDTSLREVVDRHGWRGPSKPSLGAYLADLSRHHVLNAAERQHFQQKIVDKRNKYMHEAGAMPTKLQADAILGEMHSCFLVILGRIP